MIYLELLFSFMQIGLFSIGGGYAAMPLIQSQVVELHPWRHGCGKCKFHLTGSTCLQVAAVDNLLITIDGFIASQFSGQVVKLSAGLVHVLGNDVDLLTDGHFCHIGDRIGRETVSLYHRNGDILRDGMIYLELLFSFMQIGLFSIGGGC